ncbi:MAG TPA: TadE family protein [Terriglobales bacterium]|nr:TadE family protein [Terriglobales bacterium]
MEWHMHVRESALTKTSEGSTAFQTPDRLRSPSKRRSMRGQSLVEFAMIAPLFFFLLFGVVDFGRLFFVQMTLQNAVRQAGRFAITGNHLQDPKNPGQNLSRVNSIIKIATEASAGLDISGIQISSAKGGPGSAGGPGDTVTVSITDNLKLITPIIAQFFPNGTYRFTVGVTFKNEPFSPSQSN